MATLLVERIDWDTDGMKPVKDCGLPLAVLVVNAPDEWDNDDYKDALGDELSEVYGFCHYGYDIGVLTPDSRGQRTDWVTLKDKKLNLAVMASPILVAGE